MDAFDSDVLIYAAIDGHPLGRRVAALFDTDDITDPPAADAYIGYGSLSLVPELLSKPIRDHNVDELAFLSYLLTRLDLQPVNPVTADAAAAIGAKYRLKPLDAIHLATAILMGADRFITNNRRDFNASAIREIAITYPDDLPEPVAV